MNDRHERASPSWGSEPSSRRSRRPGVLEEHLPEALQHHRGSGRALERSGLLRPRPRGSRQDLHQDRFGWVRGFEFDWKRYHIPPRVDGRDGRGPAVGADDRERGAGRLRLPRQAARHRADGSDLRGRDGRRAAAHDRPAHLVPGVRSRARGRQRVPGAALRDPRTDPLQMARGDRQGPAAGHRGLDARRARQHPFGPGRERAQPARSQLHHRRGLRLELRGSRRRRGPAGQRPLRRRPHGRRRPQHGGRRRS